MTSILSSHKDKKSMNISTTHLEEKEIIAEDDSGKKRLRQLLRVAFLNHTYLPLTKKVTVNTQVFAFGRIHALGHYLFTCCARLSQYTQAA